MNYICTWFCADEKGEESLFPQTGQKSSSASHQNIYWRCILVFFITSKRFNKAEQHLLFTNVSLLPTIEGIDVRKVLDDLDVKIIPTGFKYKTPKGYYGKFQNQFYEFSILESIALSDTYPDNHYLILDSDCIFIKPALPIFEEAAPQGFISFTDPVQPDYVINGLSRLGMKAISEELLGQKLNEVPEYHLGEFFLSSVYNIRRIYADFIALWPILLERNKSKLPKFNEEAHTLSYLYLKNDLKESRSNKFMRRIWTNPLFYRDVRLADTELIIWHLPAEKVFGIARLYQFFIEECRNYGFSITNEEYQSFVQHALGIPNLSVIMRTRYYLTSFYRKLKKSLK